MPLDTHSSNLPLCRECGGRCCAGSPGVWVDPQRFFDLFFDGQRLTLEQLRHQLADRDMVIWEASGVAMPAPGSLLSDSCVFLTPDGCRFTPAQRPCQCLALIPSAETLNDPKGNHCKLPAAFSAKEAQRRWRAYWSPADPSAATPH